MNNISPINPRQDGLSESPVARVASGGPVPFRFTSVNSVVQLIIALRRANS